MKGCIGIETSPDFEEDELSLLTLSRHTQGIHRLLKCVTGQTSYRLLRFAVAALIAAAAGAPCRAGDKVILQSKKSSSQITLPCTIIDYTGTEIKVQTRPNQPMKIYPASDVVQVLTSYTVPHERGLKQFENFQVEEATRSFEAALRAERRTWVRREILAMLVRCALRQRDYPSAGARFLLLVQSDPATKNFKLIPLIWTPETLGQEGNSTARVWLERPSEVAVLMGASLLLDDPRHGVLAQRKLVALKKSADRRVRDLAYTQLWRLKLRSREISKYELQHWEKHIDALPQALRGGPFFVLGRARSLRREHEEAAAAWLWLPLVYDHDHHLTARACLQAADALSRLGQTNEAATLYREISYRFRDTAFAQEATELLDNLSETVKRQGSRD